MGVCLSCLRPSEEAEVDETTSLLNHGLYTDANYQEELLKQQQRQNELNTITNELSDNLIDVSTFSSKRFESEFPKVASEEERGQILNAVDKLDDGTKAECAITLQAPLYLNL